MDRTTPAPSANALPDYDMDETLTADDRLRIPVHEEILVTSAVESEVGRMVVRKTVETVPYETTIDASHDEVDVQRVTINRQVETMPESRQEGDTLIVPVVEEVIVSEKRLMLREEIHITRRRVVEPVLIQDSVRREVVEVEEQVYEKTTP